MPFTKQKNGTYKSPSGRTFKKSQVVAYYAKKNGQSVLDKVHAKLKNK